MEGTECWFAKIGDAEVVAALSKLGSRVPILILHGAQDRLVPLYNSHATVPHAACACTTCPRALL